MAQYAIRPFVVGRKNWLFADTMRGAHASANLYSVIETAKANGLEPYAYLRLVFTELPRANTLADFEALLPRHIDRDRLHALRQDHATALRGWLSAYARKTTALRDRGDRHPGYVAALVPRTRRPEV